MCVLPMFIYVYHMCAWCLQRYKESGPLELELLMIMSHHVSAGNPTSVLCNSIQGFGQYPLSSPSACILSSA